MSTLAWLFNVTLSDIVIFLMIYCSSPFRSISPECLFLDPLTPPLMILNSICLMELQRKVQSAVLQRKTRLIAKSLYFILQYFISQNFGTLDPPDSKPQGCPLNDVDIQMRLRVHFSLDFYPDGMKETIIFGSLFGLRECPHLEEIQKHYSQNTPFKPYFLCTFHC